MNEHRDGVFTGLGAGDNTDNGVLDEFKPVEMVSWTPERIVLQYSEVGKSWVENQTHESQRSLWSSCNRTDSASTHSRGLGAELQTGNE